MDKEKRFVCHARIHVRDNLFGSAMVVTSEHFDDSAIALFDSASKDIENYVNTISHDEEPTPKRIKEYIEQLKRDNWSNKRIITHFAKFGITIDIPEKISEEKKLPNGQKTLGGN